MKQGSNVSTGTKETDHLRYRGYNVPALIRLVWTVFIVFSIYYMIRYGWPDLVEWMQKTPSPS